MTPAHGRPFTPSGGPTLAKALSVFAVVGLIGPAPGCDDSLPQEACPLLAPGALIDHPLIHLDLSSHRADGPLTHPEVPPGGLLAVSFTLAADQRVDLAAKQPGLPDTGDLTLFAWGPRDPFGGFAHCAAIGEGSLTLGVPRAGEYLLGVARATGDPRPIPADSLTLEALAAGAPPAAGACQPLEALGCGAMRCDGELMTDADGCPTCTCRAGTLCGPDRAAGPAGSCVLPSCRCEEAPPSPVCGSDAQTYPSRCDAACAGVTVLREAPCADACPELTTCEAPCFGPRRGAPATGCPTCDCLGERAPDPASCRSCPTDPEPVCGSDGLTWWNRCRARCGGARVLYAGACQPACARAPTGCELDCPFGLALSPSSESCLLCQCAPRPPLDCPPFGANACVALGSPPFETTVPSACVALALGASGGDWGPCGLPCDLDEDCADEVAEAPGGAICIRDGFLAGRCALPDLGPCACSPILDPVCGADGVTYPNLCALRCAGEHPAHLGACCAQGAPVCPDGEQPVRSPRGCPTGSCAPADNAGRGCAADAPVAPACDEGGDPVSGSACDANLRGEHARPELCR